MLTTPRPLPPKSTERKEAKEARKEHKVAKDQEASMSRLVVRKEVVEEARDMVVQVLEGARNLKLSKSLTVAKMIRAVHKATAELMSTTGTV